MAGDAHYDIQLAHADPGAGDDAVVVVRGEVDVAAAGALWDCIEQAGDRGPRLVLDMAGTRFMDSSGVEVLVRAVEARGRDRGAVVVRSPVPQVMRLLEITGVDALVTVERPDGPAAS